MTFSATFNVVGKPMGQPRARAFARRMGDRYVARVYDAGTAESWKGLVAHAAADVAPPAPLEGAVVVELAFRMPRPKRLCRKKDPPGELPCTSKPDVDNLSKAVLDALTQLGWWRDDAQVASLTTRKHWHARDGQPGATIHVATLTEEPHP